MPEQDEIVTVRRRKGYGDVSTPFGFIVEGDTMPMRRAEAESRDDFEIVEAEPKPAPAEESEKPKK